MPRPTPVPSPENYHVQHAPFGAFASFTFGLLDSPGGFGHALKGPARQNLYIGYKTGAAAKWKLLPYFTPPKNDETSFVGEAAVVRPPSNLESLRPDSFKRELGWASHTLTAEEDRFRFKLVTPFDVVPDPQRLKGDRARFLLAPVVTGSIEFDNRAGKEPVQLIFGIGEPEKGMRPLTDTLEAVAGFAGGRQFGYATPASSAVEMRQGFDVFAPKFRDYRGLLVIGGETALVFTVPAGKKKSFPLALGFYEEGRITTGIDAAYAYTRHFDSLEDVLAHGLKRHADYAKLAELRDRELARSALSEDQKFLLAQATHSYLGSSQLLWSAGRPLWVVNEGEYRMMNTFDLTVDHLFFELAWWPWAVRDTLDLFSSRYSYSDKIEVDGKRVSAGISFTHDMGVANQFTPISRSSYEVENIHGCFSHMTMEQLLNWILTAAVYAEKTNDRRWLKRNKGLLLACAESLHRRDHPDPAQRDGIPKFDSSRCGTDGSEITTYDSLDISLGQARNNLYLSVKALGAWVLLEQSFKRLGATDAAADAAATADTLAASIAEKFEGETGFFPAVFEAGNKSRILPAVEGFAYPLYLGLDEVIDRTGRFGALLGLLGRHIAQALQPGVCLDASSGGWKMSSTSRNTWFSKIAIAQYVVRQVFPEAMTPAAQAGDQVHALWQKQPGCGAFAMCDQILSDTGVTCGSRYYPRGVTAYLWLSE